MVDVNTDLSTAELLAVAGGAVSVVAAFLPWVRTSVQAGPVEASGTAAGIEGLGLLTLVLGVVAVAVVLALDWETTGKGAVAVVGVVVTLVSGWKVVDLGGAASPGIGLYLTVLAGIGLLAAGAWGYVDAEDGEARPSI